VLEIIRNFLVITYTRVESVNKMAQNDISYEGCNYFRQRLVLATLSGKTVKIKKIRNKDDSPGLKGK